MVQADLYEKHGPCDTLCGQAIGADDEPYYGGT
jgi:hypothetical protein